MHCLTEIIKTIPNFDPHLNTGDAVFDESRAKFAIDFIEECCTHTKGRLAGKKLLLEVWQKAVVANIFGWVKPDGTRRFREVLIFVPRKNGKTLMCAAIGCLVFFCDGEKGSEIYCAAAERDQASIVWSMAKQMVLNEPEMLSRCRVFPGTRSITNESDGSFFRPISADADTKHGFNAHCVLFDELHVQKDSELVDTLETSTGARTQPLMIYMTTSDYERPSICNQKYDYAKRVLDGSINDPSFLPVVYEATAEDDWRSPDVWKKANPNLGISFGEEYLVRQCMKAIESPSYQNTFKRLHLNIKTEQSERWLPMEKWDVSGSGATITKDDLLGRVCYAGFDLASTRDLIAFVLYFPEFFAVLPYFWLPHETAISRQESNRINYSGWVNDGHMSLTSGNVADYDVVRRDINTIGESYQIKQIAIDRWNSTQMQTQLMNDGFDVVPFGQGFASLSGPTKELDRLVASGSLVHFGNPVLRWNASNVAVERDAADNIKPSKKKSSEKIDGIVALVMAIGRSLADSPEASSIYEERGILTL